MHPVLCNRCLLCCFLRYVMLFHFFVFTSYLFIYFWGEDGDRTLCCSVTSCRVTNTLPSPFSCPLSVPRSLTLFLPLVCRTGFEPVLSAFSHGLVTNYSTCSYAGQDLNLYDPLRRRRCFQLHHLRIYTCPEIRTQIRGFGDRYASLCTRHVCGQNRIRTCIARRFKPPLYHWSYLSF
jgi:hypothetical protein